jgi:hypothetical protein
MTVSAVVEVGMRLLCWFGFHKRSRHRAHYDGAEMVSNCRHCGVRMHKLEGRWVVDRAKPATVSH